MPVAATALGAAVRFCFRNVETPPAFAEAPRQANQQGEARMSLPPGPKAKQDRPRLGGSAPGPFHVSLSVLLLHHELESAADTGHYWASHPRNKARAICFVCFIEQRHPTRNRPLSPKSPPLLREACGLRTTVNGRRPSQAQTWPSHIRSSSPPVSRPPSLLLYMTHQTTHATQPDDLYPPAP